ncbi:phenylalanine--tRNA ligase subunit beta [Blattabacterium cuenoti]|uniref:phenylalanine--tRNA ligase subunit beta n=1 Tax=Blattabacterium cuenoti TaxID=1653831 RepID=UPI00163D3BED|nr:phenylalanine--tRNA ligase subunit beta [Blattabacterium cuenoti]
MIISYNWLKEYVSIDFDVNQVSDILTNIGFPIKKIKKMISIDTDEVDYILDIEITPNRTDAMSHYGIARDLYAFLKFRGNKVLLSKPSIDNEIYNSDINYFNIQIFNKCVRYTGMAIFQTKVENSPNWLVLRLKSLGIKTINNIIDITNFVFFELGIPIHVFDLDKVEGNKILIRNAEKNNIFHIKKNFTKKLDIEDSVIYDAKKPLSIRGIIPDSRSIIHINTKNIFLGIACFNFSVNRFLKQKYLLNTENSSFFESREINPDQAIYALKRTSFLIRKITKSKIFSNIIDLYPIPNKPLEIKLRYNKIRNILGKNISKNKIKKILSLLEIMVISENNEYLFVIVPSYRTDICREIDLIEEILRIYGINNIKISSKIKIPSPTKFFTKTEYKIQKILIEEIISYGFQEIISSTMRNIDKLSLLIDSFFKMKAIEIINPVNQKYKCMRNHLSFGMIDCIEYNYNRGKSNMKFFEIGKIYYKKNGKFFEEKKLGIIISKNNNIQDYSFFYLKGIIEHILQRSGIINYTQKFSQHPLLENSISIFYNNKNLVELGKLKKIIGKNNKTFYAEIDWEYLISIIQKKNIIFSPFSIYPTSRRDLSFIVDKTLSFEIINQLIKNKKDKLIKKIQIYDIYEGKNIPRSKISYTISFLFESDKKTLTNENIHSSMKKIENILIKELNAEIRNK